VYMCRSCGPPTVARPHAASSASSAHLSSAAHSSALGRGRRDGEERGRGEGGGGWARPMPHLHRGLGSPLPHLHRDWAHPLPHVHRDRARPCHICTGTGLAPATSAPGLGSPLPHLRRDWARPCHICTGTGLLPRLHQDWAHSLQTFRVAGRDFAVAAERISFASDAYTASKPDSRMARQLCSSRCETAGNGESWPLCRPALGRSRRMQTFMLPHFAHASRDGPSSSERRVVGALGQNLNASQAGVARLCTAALGWRLHRWREGRGSVHWAQASTQSTSPVHCTQTGLLGQAEMADGVDLRCTRL